MYLNKNYVTITSILLKKILIKGKYVTRRVLDGNLVEVKCHHQINCSLLKQVLFIGKLTSSSDPRSPKLVLSKKHFLKWTLL